MITEIYLNKGSETGVCVCVNILVLKYYNHHNKDMYVFYQISKGYFNYNNG